MRQIKLTLLIVCFCIFIFEVQSLCSFALEQQIDIKISKFTKPLGYEILFFHDHQQIARKVFEKGKLHLSIGDLEPLFKDSVIVKTSGFPIQSSNKADWSVHYYKEGEIVAKRERKDGKYSSFGDIPDGLIIERYHAGKIKNLYFIKDGKKNGLALSFYANGNLKLYSYFENDKPIGEGNRFFESGAVAVEK